MANAGFPVDLLDIAIPNQSQRHTAAPAGIESAVMADGSPAGG
ncbi:MAG: hypothetical protein ABSH44_13915 [Bryobacteraceae bacterium]